MKTLRPFRFMFAVALSAVRMMDTSAQPPCPGIQPSFRWVSMDSAVVFEDQTSYPALFPDSINWDLGDGTFVSNSSSPSHTYATTGTHAVRMMTWSAGCYYETDALVTHGDGNDLCTAVLQPEFISGQPANNVLDLTDASSSAIYLDHAWFFGDGPVPEFGQAVTHAYVLPGSYVVVHTIAGTDSTTLDGCVAGMVKTLFVDGNASTCDSLLFVDFGTQGEYDAFQLSASVVDMSSIPMAISYWWDYGDQTGLEYGLSTANHSYTYPGDYQACLHVTAMASGGGDSCSAVVCHTFAPSTLGMVEDQAEGSPLLIYPVPCLDRLMITDLPVSGIAVLALFDPSGRLILSGTSLSSPWTVDVGHLAPGSYLLRAEQAGMVRYARVVKQ